MRDPTEQLRRYRDRAAARPTQIQPRGPRSMKDENEDTFMKDSIDPQNYESSSPPPVPFKHDSMPPSYVDDEGVPVKSYGHSARSRSTSPEKSIPRQSTFGSACSARSYSPEKHLHRESVSDPTYPTVQLESEEPADSNKVRESSSPYWYGKWEEEYETRRLLEAQLRSKNDELEELRRGSFSPEVFYKLQNDLTMERELREHAQLDLSQRNIDVEETRKLWKRAARELDRTRSQSQGFYQVTDPYLVGLTKQLRYNIQSFAIQYFAGERHNELQFEAPILWQSYMELATGRTTDYKFWLSSQDKCASIIQAFLWRVLVGKIFDRFRWAGDAGKELFELCRFLKPKEQEEIDGDKNMEAVRKFQAWKATTAGLLVDSISTTEESEAHIHVEDCKDFFTEKICESVEPFLRCREGGHSEQLHRILTDAIELDKEIGRQVARVEWVFPEDGIEYDSAQMEPQKGDSPPKPGQKILLALAPAMKKRGKSTGEDFHVENLLLAAEVTCEMPEKSSGK